SLGIDFELRLVGDDPVEELECLRCMFRCRGNSENVAAGERRGVSLAGPRKKGHAEVETGSFFFQHRNCVIGASLHSDLSAPEDLHWSAPRSDSAYSGIEPSFHMV